MPVAAPGGVNRVSPTPRPQQVHAPPERRLHTGIQSEYAILADDLPHDIEGAAVGACQGLVLQPTINGRSSPDSESTERKVHILDLDELKGHDDKTFGGARAATGDDGKLPRHFGLAGERPERFPPEIICRAEVGKVIT